MVHIRSMIVTCAAVLAAAECFPRSLEEIKKSGVIRFAVREEPAFYNVTNLSGAAEGLHYQLANAFARRLGVAPVFRTVRYDDYFDLRDGRYPRMLDAVDIIADSITLSSNVPFAVVPFHHTSAVCLYRNTVQFEDITDLTNMRTTVVERSGVSALVSNISRDVSNFPALPVVLSVKGQVKALSIGSIDYIITGFPEALFHASRDKGFSIDMDLLSPYTMQRPAGWGCAADATAISNEIADFLNVMRTTGMLERIWSEHLHIGYREYQNVASIGTYDHFSKAVDMSYQERYDQSVVILRTAIASRIFSEKNRKLYDIIYLNWLRKLKKDTNAAFERVDEYFDTQPTRYFVTNFREREPEIYDPYLVRVRTNVSRELSTDNIDKAIAGQRVVLMLTENAPDERKKYDDIRFEQIKRDTVGTNTLSAIDDHLDGRPSAYFAKRFKRDFPNTFSDYIFKLKTEREDAILDNDIDRAIRIQERMFELDPGSLEESENLNVLRVQKKKRTQPGEPTPVALRDNAPDNFGNVYFLATNTNTGRPSVEMHAVVDASMPVVATNLSERAVELAEGKRFFELGESLYKQKKYQESLSPFESARKLNYNPEKSVEYVARVKRMLEEDHVRTHDDRMKKFEVFFERAIMAYTRREYSTALENISLALEIFPDNQQAQKYYRIITDILRIQGETTVGPASPYYRYFIQRMAAADEAIAARKYDAGRTIVEEVLLLFPNAEAAREKLIICLYKTDPSRMKTILDDYAADAKKLIELGRMPEAHAKLTFIKKIRPDYPGLDAALKRSAPEEITLPREKEPASFNYAATVKSAADAAANGKLAEALALYRSVLRYRPEDYKSLLAANRIENQIAGGGGRIAAQEAEGPGRERAENLYLKGQFYFRIRNYNEAIRYWEESYRADTTFKKSLLSLERVRRLMDSQ
ncbi:MAG: transporter substrate-binding domain-containing protein [Spirochaetota bacterium]